jgi:hypothetical protein
MKRERQFFMSTSTRAALVTTLAAMDGVETRGHDDTRDVVDTQAGVAIPCLSFDLVVAHVLREKHLPDPADLAVIRSVSRGMRDAVDATGRKIEELDEETSVERGCLTTLKCLHRRGRVKKKSRLCAAAARIGDLEELKALRRESGEGGSFPWDEETCAFAAWGGHLEVLKWAHSHGCPWDGKTCKYAAMFGHLESLQWARANGCQWNWKTCASAAQHGRLDVLKWARENGAPWGEETCACAAFGGRLEVLQWARDSGCPWDAMTCASRRSMATSRC